MKRVMVVVPNSGPLNGDVLPEGYVDLRHMLSRKGLQSAIMDASLNYANIVIRLDDIPPFSGWEAICVGHSRSLGDPFNIVVQGSDGFYELLEKLPGLEDILRTRNLIRRVVGGNIK